MTKELAPKKMGRPTKYSLELVAEILTRIAEGESLRKITMEPSMPSHASVYLWLLQYPEFSENYAKARNDQAETLADEIIAIADEPPAEVTDDKGVSRTDSGWVSWQRNRVEARKWVAAKLKPTKYGDVLKLQGDKDNPLEIKANVEIFGDILTNMQASRQVKSK